MAAREMAMLKSVLDSIPGAKTNAPEIRVVSPEERAQLMKALPTRVGLIARFLYATAARVTEALKVRLGGHQDGRGPRTPAIPRQRAQRTVGEDPNDALGGDRGRVWREGEGVPL